MNLVVDACLVELLLNNMPYEELVGYYEYTEADIDEACYYISHSVPDDLIALMDELEAEREEEDALWEVWAEHCF